MRRYTLPDWKSQTYIMGIINITPDSFSGDGLFSERDPIKAALGQAERFVADGASILDIGGESTRPGARPVSEEEELERVIPVIESLRTKFPEILLSIDTWKSGVAKAAVEAGADWINDVWGLLADPDMANTVATLNVPIILMHNRSTPSNTAIQTNLGGRYVGVVYENFLNDVKKELIQSVQIAQNAGIHLSHIIIDPGIGFGKTVEQNLNLLNHLDQIVEIGFPVLLGVSRKSFIGYTLNLPPEERLEGSLAANAVGILRGANILRVHDVKETVRLARMIDQIIRHTEIL